jgi:hypothetical protein
LDWIVSYINLKNIPPNIQHKVMTIKKMKLLHVSTLMFVDPCIFVQFIKKNPTRRNNISKFLLFHIYVKLNSAVLGS